MSPHYKHLLTAAKRLTMGRKQGSCFACRFAWLGGMQMRWPWVVLAVLAVAVSDAAADPGDGNRLTYLDGSDPYYVGRDFPKLITPQWVGEEGVEAVIVLAIDD